MKLVWVHLEKSFKILSLIRILQIRNSKVLIFLEFFLGSMLFWMTIVTWAGIVSLLMAIKNKGEGEGRMACRTLAMQTKYREIVDYLNFWRSKVFSMGKSDQELKICQKVKV